MAGLGLASARAYWDIKLATFRPDVVVIYPTPAMNINEATPRWALGLAPGGAPPEPAAARESAPLRSRLVDRLREFVHTPAVIDDWRIRRALAAQLRAHPAGWVKNEPSPADLALFTAQLEALIAHIGASGAQVVLMTHAGRITPSLLATHRHDALWLQADIPNVTPAAQLAFTALANERIRDVSRGRNLPLVDLDKLLSGCLECFVDPAHFTDRGAGLAASAAAASLSPLETVTDRSKRVSSR
jgi:hypothetical protein